MLHVFTSAAVNYLPKVRVLSESIKKYHPNIFIHLLLADEKPEWLNVENEPFDYIITINELNIKNKDGWIFFHNIVELSTALKPFALQYILNLPNCEGVLFFDPDIAIFHPLTELSNLLSQKSIILTPHQTTPEKSVEAILDNEICSLQHGMFNLGFIGVRADNNGHDFANWWADRLYYFCQDNLSKGLFTDQKWANFIPIFFENVYILKASQYNVAPWNLSTRNVTGDLEAGFLVDGKPLIFYHFTGFDSGAHEGMANKYAKDNEAIKVLIAWYKNQNTIKSNTKISNTPWAFRNYSNNRPIEKSEREIYRSRVDLQNIYPNPFIAGENSFLAWVDTQGKIEYRHLLHNVKKNEIAFILRSAIINPKYLLFLIKRAVHRLVNNIILKKLHKT